MKQPPWAWQDDYNHKSPSDIPLAIFLTGLPLYIYLLLNLLEYLGNHGS